jgi:uncharacterized protein
MMAPAETEWPILLQHGKPPVFRDWRGSQQNCINIPGQFYGEKQQAFSSLKHYRPFCFIQTRFKPSQNQKHQRPGKRLRRGRPVIVAVAIALTTLGSGLNGNHADAQTQPGQPLSEIWTQDVRKAKAAFDRKDYAEALRLFGPLADQGNAVAETYMGIMYVSGDGVAADNARGLDFLRKATDQGFVDAQAVMGILYGRGYAGLPRDDRQAAIWNRKAAEQGHVDAEARLGEAYLTGAGVDKDYEQALPWLRKAAESGNDAAQAELGWMYETGASVAQNYAVALNWYQKAAQRGNAQAETHLGLMYYDGHAGTQDYAQAAVWFGKGAEQGNADAQVMLGLMYANGLGGLPKDYRQMMIWWRKAADQGDAEGEYRVGLLYGAGVGVKLNLDEAEKWLRLAAAQGHEEAKQHLAALEEEKQRQANGQNAVPPSLQFKCFLEAFDPKVAGAGGNTDLIQGIKRSSNDPRYEACIEKFNKKYDSQRQ